MASLWMDNVSESYVTALALTLFTVKTGYNRIENSKLDVNLDKKVSDVSAGYYASSSQQGQGLERGSAHGRSSSPW